MADIKRLVIGSDWTEPGSSTEAESLIVEIEMALGDAPNVESIHFLFDAFGDVLDGVAVALTDGKRGFYLAGRGETMTFGPSGELRMA